MKKIFTSPFFTPCFYIITWGMLLFIVLAFFNDKKFTITEDWHLIDIITNLGYLFMFGTMIYLSKDYKGKMTVWGTYLFLGICAFLREGGIQHHLSSTDSTPFKSRFFLNPNNPLSEKIIFGAVLLIVLAAVLYIAVKYSKHLIVSFFKMNTITWSVAVLCVVGIGGKFADRFPSKWKKLHDGIELPREQIEIWSLLEESSEMFLPYLVIIIFWQYHLLAQKQKD